jgi:hypothetical protein
MFVPPDAPKSSVAPDPPAPAKPASRVKAYLWVLLTGTLGYLVISAVLLSAYLLTQGDRFLVPDRMPSLSFIQLFGAPTFLAAFVPFAGTHMIASALGMRITTSAAVIAGTAMGSLGAWAICGRQGCFSAYGAFPLLGWHILAACMLTALFYQLNARKHGF